MNNLFSLSLPKGQWKWWLALPVIILPIVPLIPQILLVILIPIILTRSIDRGDHGLVLSNWKKILIVSIIAFILFTVAVHLFEKYTPNAQEASKKVMDSLGFGQTFSRDFYTILSICVLAPVGEELTYRGLGFRPIWNTILSLDRLGRYKHIVALVVASAVSAFFFTSAHGGEGQDDQLIMICLLSVLASVSYAITGSLYAPVLFHSLNNSLVMWQSIDKYKLPLTEPSLMYIAIAGPIVSCLILYFFQFLMNRLKRN